MRLHNFVQRIQPIWKGRFVGRYLLDTSATHMKHLSIIIWISLAVCKLGYTQVIPTEYNLLTKIDRPLDLKWGLPDKILIDSTNSVLVLSYDYNPTYLDFYQMQDWKLIGRVKVKGHVYMDNSYFHPAGGTVYIDVGRNRNKYIKIDLETFAQSAIDCEDVPRGCPYSHIIHTISEYDDAAKITIINSEWYIIKFDSAATEIYVKW